MDSRSAKRTTPEQIPAGIYRNQYLKRVDFE